MTIISVPLGQVGSVSVNEANDTLSIVVDATVLGTPENVTLNFSLATLLMMLSNAIISPVAKAALAWISTLL